MERIGGTENGGERMRGGGWKKVFRVAPYVLRHRYKYSVSILDRHSKFCGAPVTLLSAVMESVAKIELGFRHHENSVSWD